MQAARTLPAHVDETGPRPVVVGTDIKVAHIAWEYEHHGMSPDEIVDAHPHISLADVHAALAYFYDHMDAIRADWRVTDEIIAEMMKRFPPRDRSRPSSDP
jgi:uncharacterized protein (DUF433 family)